MELEEMKNVWKKQEVSEPVNLTKEKLMMILNNQLISFDEQLKKRDLLETSVALLIVVACGLFLFLTQSVWYQLGCVTLILACGIIIYKLKSARRGSLSQNLNSDISFGDHLKEELHKLESQRRLLKSMLWWYLFPIFLGIIFFVIGANQQILIKSVYLAAVIILYAYIWKRNQDAVAEKIDPIINDVKEAIDFLNSKD